MYLASFSIIINPYYRYTTTLLINILLAFCSQIAINERHRGNIRVLAVSAILYVLTSAGERVDK